MATRNELKAEAVIDHREAAGGEREAALVVAGDIFTAGRFVERPPALRRQLLAKGVQLALPQRLDQVAAEADATALTFRQTLRDQVLGATVKASRTSAPKPPPERDRFTGDSLPVKPGGAGCRDLLFDREVRADRQRDAASPLSVVELAQLDDRAWRAVTGGVEIGQLDVMGPSVRAVDHGIGGAFQLVVETASHQAADDGIVQAFAG